MKTTCKLVLTLMAIPVAVLATEAMPVPKVFRDTPAEKGQWRVEMLDFQRSGMKKEEAAAMPKSMSVCMDAVMDMAEGTMERTGKSACPVKIIEDTGEHATVETVCPDGRLVHSSITRTGPGAFLIEATSSGTHPFEMKARYVYEGACRQGKNSSAVSFAADSEVCRKMRAQFGQMDPATACASVSGAARTMCEQQMQQTLGKFKGMCP